MGWASGWMACHSELRPRDLRAFYLDETDLKNGIVFEYQPTDEDRLPPFYVHSLLVESEDTTWLLSTYYDYEYRPYQMAREELRAGGSLLRDFKLYAPADSTGTQRIATANIEQNAVFPFRVGGANTEALVYAVNWQDPTDPATRISLLRNRQYAGDTTFIFRGEPLDAVRFNLRELVDTEQNGHLEQEYGGYEIYARGLGLVAFRKEVSPDFAVAYELSDTFPMKELEMRFAEQLKLSPDQ